ncbi:MAG: hypothetical protein R2855_17430 [Thermomicrobiales bacterium]
MGRHAGLCEEIKGAGIAPWTYQGQYPQYIRLLFDAMVAKNGGMEQLINTTTSSRMPGTKPA